MSPAENVPADQEHPEPSPQKRDWVSPSVSELGFEMTSNTFSGTNPDGTTLLKPGLS